MFCLITSLQTVTPRMFIRKECTKTRIEQFSKILTIDRRESLKRFNNLRPTLSAYKRLTIMRISTSPNLKSQGMNRMSFGEERRMLFWSDIRKTSLRCLRLKILDTMICAIDSSNLRYTSEDITWVRCQCWRIWKRVPNWSWLILICFGIANTITSSTLRVTGWWKAYLSSSTKMA